MTRYFMVADLTKHALPESGSTPLASQVALQSWRPIADGNTDAETLAILMLDAYRGTTDDQGETIVEARAEVAKLFANEYGVFERNASVVYDANGTLASATIVTRIRSVPFLAFSMTAPTHKRQGLARFGLTHVMSLLAERGERTLRLMVTSGNTPAETLYASLGFVAENR